MVAYRTLLTLLLSSLLFAEQALPKAGLASLSAEVHGVPRWILAGILYRETRSYYTSTGEIIYVNRIVGKHGEVSAFQITPRTRRHIERLLGIPHKSLTDQRLAELYAATYLSWIYCNKAGESWDTTIRMYNAGPNGPIYAGVVDSYLAEIKGFQ